VKRETWKNPRDSQVEALMDRFDEVMDLALQRWRAAEIAKVDAQWEKLVLILPDDRVWDWLDHLEACVRSGAPGDGNARWSPTFPVAEHVAPVNIAIKQGGDTAITVDALKYVHSRATLTPARARREQRFADVQRLVLNGARQSDIAEQLGLSQATVSNWVRRGI
jgi:hypothetical protein